MPWITCARCFGGTVRGLAAELTGMDIRRTLPSEPTPVGENLLLFLSSFGLACSIVEGE